MILTGHKDDRFDLGIHQPIGMCQIKFEFEVTKFSQATNNRYSIVFTGKFNREAFENGDLYFAHTPRGFTSHRDTFGYGKPRVFGIARGDGNDDTVKKSRGTTENIDVSQGDGVEGAGVNSDALLAGHGFPVATHFRPRTLSRQARMQSFKHIPNLLTALRLPAVFVIALWTSWAGVWASAALALFIFAALTDIFDGWIARKLGAVSDFGRLMDALVDKIFILGLLVALMAIDCLPVQKWDDAGVASATNHWAVLISAFGVILILMREFLITGLRLVAAAKGQVLEAERLGKIKTFLQILAIGHLIGLRAYETHWKLSAVWHQRWEVIITGIFWLSVILTVVSGLSYFIRHRRHLPGLSESE